MLVWEPLCPERDRHEISRTGTQFAGMETVKLEVKTVHNQNTISVLIIINFVCGQFLSRELLATLYGGYLCSKISNSKHLENPIQPI